MRKGTESAERSGVMAVAESDLFERTRRFALDVLEFLKTLPRDEPGPTVKRQLTRAATGVSANYRAARRSRSHAEFTSRISVVAEEADESQHWLDLSASAGLSTSLALPGLLRESRELTAIFSAMVRTARSRDRCR